MIKTTGRVKYIISEQIFQNRRESTDILEEESVHAGDISEQVFDRGKSIFVVKYSFSFNVWNSYSYRNNAGEKKNISMYRPATALETMLVKK